MESLFQDWVQEGMLIRLDIRHWLHRWDVVVIKQTHSKYGAFMSAMAGAILAYSDGDMAKLTSAIRKGNEALYASYIFSGCTTGLASASGHVPHLR